jgi:hypothetical protein
VQSAFVKGDINTVITAELDYLYRVLSGMGAGTVEASDQVPPIVLDFRALCKEYRIKTDTVLQQETTLDILKNPAHYRKSRFFHQLDFLETGFCRCIKGPDYVTGKSKNLVREEWACRYDSKVETSLIDNSVFGATVSEACAVLTARRFRDSMTAEELGKLLIAAEVMGLESFYEANQEKIFSIIDGEGNFISAASCLGSLRYLKNLQILLRSKVDSFMPVLLGNCYRRAVYLMEEGRNIGSDEEKKAAESLRSLYAFTVEEGAAAGDASDAGCDPALFADMVERILGEGFCNSRFYGVLLGIYEKLGRIDTAELARRISARLATSVDDPADAASFIAGVFLIGRDALFAGDDVLREIDRVVAAMDDDSFIAILPNFRQAFTSFLPRESDRLGRMAAELCNLNPDKVRRIEAITREELVMGISLDKKAAEAMAKWF